MRAFALFATIVALVHGRPEAGYSYNKPSISPDIYNPHDTYASSGASNLFSGGSFGVGINGGSFDAGGISNAGFSSSSFSSGSSAFSGNIGLGANAIGSSGIGGGTFGGGSGTLVQKHIYVHVPPAEPEEIRHRQPISVAPAQKHYKIIFIKAPTVATPTAPVIPLQPQSEEKTLVYVLVKRPDDQPDIHIPAPVPTQPSKPEVYFIRYKTQKEGIGGGSGITGGTLGGRTGVIGESASGSSIDGHGGISSSSLGDIGIGSSSSISGSADNLIGSGGHDIISSSVSSSSQSHSQSSSSSSSVSSSYGPPGHNTGY